MTAPAPGSVRPLKRTARDTRGKLLLLADDIGRVYGDGAREMTALLREVDTRLQQVVALLDDDSGTYTPEQVAARKEARVEMRLAERRHRHPEVEARLQAATEIYPDARDAVARYVF